MTANGASPGQAGALSGESGATAVNLGGAGGLGGVSAVGGASAGKPGTSAGGVSGVGGGAMGGAGAHAGGNGGASNAGAANGGTTGAGGNGAASSAGATNGSGGTTGAVHGLGDPWTFDSSLQGWGVRDHSGNITTTPTASGGAASFAGVPFTMASEYLDFALPFSANVSLAGLTLHARIRRVSGAFVGAQLYAYGGAWLGSTFTSLNSADFVDIPLAIDSTAKAGFDPTKVSRIGIKLSTGSNASNTFGATTLELDSVTVE
jgi:hypothetical protein